MNIAIPEYFSLYNEDMREGLEVKGWTVNFTIRLVYNQCRCKKPFD